MEIALTRMEFVRRARRLYGEREAVVDGDLPLTYAQFLERCDRWSSALQAPGVRQGDRVAYIAPNAHAHLEDYYAVPQIGAVLVPSAVSSTNCRRPQRGKCRNSCCGRARPVLRDNNVTHLGHRRGSRLRNEIWRPGHARTG